MVDYKSFLDTTVLQEKKPVTFKLLARTLNIHVNLAKQALYQYATSEPTVTAIYCITGSLEDNATSIQLVESDKLEETKKQFLQVSSVFIYSIIPYQPKDLSVLVLANKDIMDVSREDRIKNGLIQNKEIELKTATQPTTPSKPTVNIQPSHHANQIKTTTSNRLTESTTTTSKATPVKRKGTLSFENMGPKSKKSTTETAKSTIETSNPSSTTKKRVIKSIQESDEDEDEEDEESLDARLARSASLHVNDIFSDDEDMADDSKNTKTTDNKNHDKKETTTPDMDIDNDNDHNQNEAESSTLSDENENHEVAPGKIRRKVQKKKTYKNERGFLVTETVWEWEEVDDDTEHKNTGTSTTKAPSSLQPSKTAKKPANSKKTEQKSLLSFWGKR